MERREETGLNGFTLVSALWILVLPQQDIKLGWYVFTVSVVGIFVLSMAYSIRYGQVFSSKMFAVLEILMRGSVCRCSNLEKRHSPSSLVGPHP